MVQSSRRAYSSCTLHDSLRSLMVLVLGICCCCCSTPYMVTRVSSALTAQCNAEAQLILAACNGSDATVCCNQMGQVLATDPDCYCQFAAENSSDTSGNAQLLQFMRSVCVFTVPPSVVACLSGEIAPPPIGASPPPMEATPPPESTTISPPPVEVSPPLDSTTPTPSKSYPPPLTTIMESPPPPIDVGTSLTSPPPPPSNDNGSDNSTTSTTPRTGLFRNQASALSLVPFPFVVLILAISLLLV